MFIIALGVYKINNTITSQEAILNVCRELVSANGISTLNMREVAKACNVALGSIYNYFPSKDDLILATIESVWKDIFHINCKCTSNMPLDKYINSIFFSVLQSAEKYPNFLTAHSLSLASSEKSKAKNVMDRYFVQIKNDMANALASDSAVTKTAFNESFKQDDFIDFIMTNLIILFMQEQNNCEILIEIIRRTIYK